MLAKLNSVLQYIKLIDIFGIKTEFRIDKKPKFQTLSGAFFTLLYICFIILLFFTFGGDMIKRKTPETSISQTLTLSPSPTLVSPASYFFVFGLQDSTATHFINESIYIPHLFHIQKNQTTQKYESKEVPLQPCSEEILPTDPFLRQYFSRQAERLSDLYCISPEGHNELIIEGAWDQDKFSYLQLSIEQCRDQPSCLDQALIGEKLKTGDRKSVV